MPVPYLVANKPRVAQFRTPRRAKPSGVIVVHTAESVMDTVGPDTGAENVASFIQRRSDYGSYHWLVDSDSAVFLVPYTAEAYGDGTGSNTHAIHISFACRTTDWAKMSATRKRAFIQMGAATAADAAQWLQRNHGVKVPAKRITRPESDARTPGFITHGERDPGRRSDPGQDFPWDMFMAEYAKLMGVPEVRFPRIVRLEKRTTNRRKQLAVDVQITRKALSATAAKNKVRRKRLTKVDKKLMKARKLTIQANTILNQILE